MARPYGVDEEGNRYGMLTVIRKDKDVSTKHNQWVCKCDCGEERSVRMGMLKAGRTKSCGCLRRSILKQKHQDRTGKRKRNGVCAHPLYDRWKALRFRAKKGGTIFWPDWNRFKDFLNDVGTPPIEDYSIYFLCLHDDSKGYVPGNTFWSLRMRTKPSGQLYDSEDTRMRWGFGVSWTDEMIVAFIREDQQEDKPIKVQLKWTSPYVRF